MGSTEQQIIIALAGTILTGVGALLGNRVPRWWESYRRWHTDRALLLSEHAQVRAERDTAIRERDEARASLNAAHEGVTVRRDLIDGLQDQINDLKADFTRRIDDAIRYIVDLTVYIRDRKTGPLPEPPDSISDDVRAEIERIELGGSRA